MFGAKVVCFLFAQKPKALENGTPSGGFLLPASITPTFNNTLKKGAL